jgi:hypothetical protein
VANENKQMQRQTRKKTHIGTNVRKNKKCIRGIEIALALGHKLHLQKLGRKYVDKCDMDRKKH